MQPKTKASTASVLIVGAGISGLAAAAESLKRGFQALVLEGRARPGGRIWTDRSMQVPIDLGAAWIHGKSGNPLYKLARKHQIRMEVTDYSRSSLLDENGKTPDFLSRLAFSGRAGRILPRLKRLRKGLSQDVSVAEAVGMVVAKSGMSKEELCFLNRHLIEFQAYNAASLEEQSLFHLIASAESRHGEDLLFPEGYSQLTDKMADGLTIKFEETVQLIEQDGQGVSVETDKGSYKADAAIVTLPLGVLQSSAVEFKPSLPERKLAAIGRLKMGLFNKIAMRFQEVFWDKESDLIEMIGSDSSLVFQFLNLYRHCGEPVLVGCVAADTAREFEQLSDEGILKRSVDLLHRLFPGKATSPSQATITRWGQDKFSRGSYSVVLPGTTEDDFNAIAEPFERLYFAGEACTYHGQGTAHGAYQSGVHAATQMSLQEAKR